MKNLYGIFSIILFIVISNGISSAQMVLTPQNAGTTKLLYCPYFTDANTGTIVGQQGTILRTTDGGQTWTSQNSNSEHSLTRVYFSDKNHGVAIGASGTVLKTTNGGQTWVNQQSGFTDYFLTALSFASPTVGFAAGENGIIIKTTNGGTSWIKQVSNISDWIYGIDMTDSNTGTAVSLNGGIVRTTDGGETWINQNSGTSDDLWGVYFTDINKGTVVGDHGTILKTTDGGQTWVKQNSGTSNWLRAISFSDSSNGIVAGENGIVLRTTDGGQTWVEQYSGTTSDLVGAFISNFFAGTIVGTDGLILKVQTSNYVQLVSPRGGEIWNVGSTHEISWNSTEDINSVKLEYTTDNGANWITITDGVTASERNYNWVVPNKASTQCKVSVSDANNPATLYESDSTFTIRGRYLTLLYPVGGEELLARSSYDIKWNSTNIEKIKIEYSTNSGNSWWPITFSTKANTGLFKWEVPNSPSTKCKVKITDLSDSSFYVESDSVFKISPPSLKLTSPVNGDIWNVGLVGKITWTQVNVENIKIELSIDNGISWYLINNSTLAYVGQYNIIIPNWPSAKCRIRISDISDPTIKDVTDGVFEIYRELNVVSPNGGEKWKAGSKQNITWSGVTSQKILIQYSTNNGNNWLTIVDSVLSNPTSYEWNLPDIKSEFCKIRIIDASNAHILDESDQTFTIYQPILSLTSPNGGENWFSSTLKNITWISDYVSEVKLEYTTNTGEDWNLIADSITATLSSYSWNIPSLNSTHCKVRVSDITDSTVTDETDGLFSIMLPTLTLVTPNGGENWHVDKFETITWTSKNVNDIKIEYSTDNGSTWIAVIDNITANIGAYVWKIPNTKSEICKVKISDTGNSNIYDESDKTFLIYQPVLKLTSPNGGENWNSGTTKNITWTSEYVNSVKLEYSTSNGSSWILIADSIKANPANYSWIVPNVNSSDCKVRISASDESGVNDESDNVFVISPLIGVDENQDLPTEYILYPNYPNPFNPTTVIDYQIPNAGFVQIKVYNSLGKEIATLVNEERAVGRYRVEFNGTNLSSGVYFYLIKSEDYVHMRKMILLK